MGQGTSLYRDPSQDRFTVLLGLIGLLSDEPPEARRVAAAILHKARETLEAQAAHLVLKDWKTGRAEVVMTSDDDGFREVPVPEGSALGESVRWSGPGDLARSFAAAEGRGWLGELRPSPAMESRLLHLPVGRNARVHGALIIVGRDDSAFSGHDIAWAQALASLLALDASLRRRGAELERIRTESTSLERTSRSLASSLDAERVLNRTVSAAGELLGAADVAIWVSDGDKVRCVASHGPAAPPADSRPPPDVSSLERVLNEGRNVILGENAHGGSQVIVPLHGARGILGALQVKFDVGADGPQGRQGLLSRLADHAAVAYENALLHNTVRTLSLTDPLTGLYNRRQLDIHLGQEFAAAERGRPLSVVLFDVDGFKTFNDREGHVVGDRVLAAVGRLLREETRAMNLAARYGGDEFMVVLSDTDAEGADKHVERIQRRFAEDPELRDLGVALSAGYATFNPSMARPEDLISEADRDLYRSKGRDPGAPTLRMAGPESESRHEGNPFSEEPQRD